MSWEKHLKSVKIAAETDQAAYEALHRLVAQRWGNLISRFARSMNLRIEDAVPEMIADLTMALRKAKWDRIETKVDSWCYAIIHKRMISARSKESRWSTRHRPLEDFHVPHNRFLPPPIEAEFQELCTRLQDHLKPTEYAILMRQIDGKTTLQIAEELGYTPATVRAYRGNARKRLERWLRMD